MPVNPDNSQPVITEKMKHLYWIKKGLPLQGVELKPYVHIEIRIDFNDIRTGFRETVSLSKALEIYSNAAELLWTDDMIRDVDCIDTSSSVPEGSRLGTLPDYVNSSFVSRMESQFSQYLLRSYEARIYRNFDLNLYSNSGESQADFTRRCLELYEEPRRNELDRLHEVFVRRLEQTRQKYMSSGGAEGLEQSKIEFQNKDAFSRCCERIAELFLHSELSSNPVPEVPLPIQQLPELEYRLASIELESQQAVTKLCSVYEEKARSLDEYILHPNLKDIHFVRSCILWMPEEPVA
jgi:hypothetical protein